LLAAAATLRTALGAPLPPVMRAGHERVEAGLRARLGAAEFAESRAAGAALPLEAAITAALRDDTAGDPSRVGEGTG
jgi:hypothetical protein